jgi:hypothetical protein
VALLEAPGSEKRAKGEGVRSAALLVAVLAIVVGVVGLVSPDTVMTVRRRDVTFRSAPFCLPSTNLRMYPTSPETRQ